MKKILIFLIPFFIISCVTLQKPPENPISIQEIIASDKSKIDLFVLSNEWMVRNFVSSKTVIQYSDKEEGIIIGKAFFNTTYNYNPLKAWFTMKINVKDGKSRILINDIYGEDVSGKTYYFENEEEDRYKIEGKVADFIKDYNDFIQKELTEW